MNVPYCNSHENNFNEIGKITDEASGLIITIFKSPCCNSYMIRPLSAEIGLKEQNEN